ncbi:glycosyltransferase family 39 protein [Laccaria amethystina LaAM-08-1]|uniref:Glycosyltransferase family 39 protein n=1 Tax=Laccaria amethystina LaAM-08-1 TaxID=1095629 RepID=A0A0C9WLG7_9AGAR|nr:glycosyltransferase family 39 protein [Laccaria amethystina LaAM-08-1]
MFEIHFLILENTGDGDQFMSSEFQRTVGGRGMADTLPDVAVESIVTKTDHSVAYPHRDSNNVFRIFNATLGGGTHFHWADSAPEYINKNAVKANSLWFIETSSHSQLPPDAPTNYKLPGFFAKFWGLQHRQIGGFLISDLSSGFVLNPDIYTTARDLSVKGLQELAAKYPKTRLALIELNVTDVASIKKASEEVATLLPNGLDHFDLKLFADELSFNTVTVIQMTSAFLPLVKKFAVKKIIFITFVLGGSWPFISNSYSISKAALNMLARKWGAVLKHEGVTVALIHPVWLQTDLGDGIKGWVETYAKNVLQITTAQSSAGVVAAAKNVTIDSTASFYNYDGSKPPF